MSRTKDEIYNEIKDLKLEIKEATWYNDERLAERLYLELDKLEEEFYNASTNFSTMV